MGSVIHVHTGGAIGKRRLWRHSDGVSSRYEYQNQGLVDVPDPSDKIILNTLKSYCCKLAGIYILHGVLVRYLPQSHPIARPAIILKYEPSSSSISYQTISV